MNVYPTKIKPGHHNNIALTVTQISADSTIKTIDSNRRKCFFGDEVNEIKMHRKYSQVNCIFECSLAQAKKESNLTCTPWFFPSIDKNERICDPLEKIKLLEIMETDITHAACDHCLPDCDRTIYHPMVTNQEFRVCDEKNFGMTELCSFDSIDVWPQIWANQVLNQINGDGLISDTSNMMKKIKSSIRKKTLFVDSQLTFKSLTQEYESYQDDIAVVSVYFSSPTVMKFSTTINKTWIDFLSAMGGNVGLFIGFSFVTIFELIWLVIRIGTVHFAPSNNNRILTDSSYLSGIN